MIIPFHELKHHPFCVSDVDVFVQRPQYNYLSVNSRLYNGFICIKSGSCRYTDSGGSFVMSDGAVAYVPLNSKHLFEILSDSIEFYRIDFSVTVNNEKVFFSKTPIKLSDNAPQECFEALAYLATNFIGYENTVEKTEKMCTVFRTLLWSDNSNTKKRIEPALRYISEAPARRIDCKELSKLCFLGTSQFYSLFKQETGTTPLEYRNNLLVRQSIILLESTDRSINEISSMLGFESTAYFSRFFKKHTGRSPMKYRKNE